MKNNFPETKIKNIKENIHGAIVPDFYRWLENSNSPEVKKWDKKQNNYAKKILNKISGRTILKKEFKENLSFDSIGTPLPKASRYFFIRHRGLQNQPVLYAQDKIGGKERVIIDLNKLSKSGHGQGKSLNKFIEESVDIWSFIFWQLGLLKDKQDKLLNKK